MAYTLVYVIFFVYFDLLPHKWGPLRKYVRVLWDICKHRIFLPSAPFVASDYSAPSSPTYRYMPPLCERCSICPLGGVFCRMGTAKLVEQGASYSEGYIRYPNGTQGLKYHLHFPQPLSQSLLQSLHPSWPQCPWQLPHLRGFRIAFSSPSVTSRISSILPVKCRSSPA